MSQPLLVCGTQCYVTVLFNPPKAMIPIELEGGGRSGRLAAAVNPPKCIGAWSHEAGRHQVEVDRATRLRQILARISRSKFIEADVSSKKNILQNHPF